MQRYCVKEEQKFRDLSNLGDFETQKAVEEEKIEEAKPPAQESQDLSEPENIKYQETLKTIRNNYIAEVKQRAEKLKNLSKKGLLKSSKPEND